MDIMQYLTDKSLHLIPMLYIIGIFLKSTPRIPDWLIPWILTVIGIVCECAILGFGADGVIQGVFAAGGAVLGNQLYKQTIMK